MKNKFSVIILAFSLMSCAPTSIQQENAKARYEEYKSAYKSLDEAEWDYLILLSNLERYPKDEYLLMKKKLLRKEIEQYRVLMLQARGEFDSTVIIWDIFIQGMDSALPDTSDFRQIFGLPPSQSKEDPME